MRVFFKKHSVNVIITIDYTKIYYENLVKIVANEDIIAVLTKEDLINSKEEYFQADEVTLKYYGVVYLSRPNLNLEQESEEIT